MSILEALLGKGPSGFGYGSTAEQVTEGLDLTGQSLLVTGAASGLGKETARVLMSRGARVLAAGRSKDSVRAALGSLPGDFVALECSLAEPASVRSCVQDIMRENVKLSAIIANAGIMALPKLEQAYGYELQFFTNHIGHFLLVTSLLGQLTEGGRVVVLSSDVHKVAGKIGIDFQNLSGERGYSPVRAYGQSKLANVLFVKELAKRLIGTGKTANAVHPGVIKTNLSRSMPRVIQLGMELVESLILKSVAQGAATQCYVATHPQLAGVSGEYFADCNIAKPSSLAQDAALAARLWDESEKILAKL